MELKLKLVVETTTAFENGDVLLQILSAVILDMYGGRLPRVTALLETNGELCTLR